MASLLLYRVKASPGKVMWRVNAPDPAGVTDYRKVNFRRREDALCFYRAARKELKASGRDKAVDFLTSPHKLLDALRALRLLRDRDTGPWQNRLTRGANLLAMLEETRVKTPGSFVEPASRVLELPPDLHRLVVALARRRGENVSDMIAGYLAKVVKEENEASLKLEEPKGRVRLGDLYRQRA